MEVIRVIIGWVNYSFNVSVLGRSLFVKVKFEWVALQFIQMHSPFFNFHSCQLLLLRSGNIVNFVFHRSLLFNLRVGDYLLNPVLNITQIGLFLTFWFRFLFLTCSSLIHNVFLNELWLGCGVLGKKFHRWQFLCGDNLPVEGVKTSVVELAHLL